MMNPAQPTESSISYWLPLITAILGFLFGGLSEWLRDSRAYKRERESQGLTTNREREARESAPAAISYLSVGRLFNAKHCLNSEELAKLIRATGEGHHLDVMAERSSGNWQKQLYGADLNNRCHAANVKTLLLGVRKVSDVTTRTLVMKLKEPVRKQ